MSPTAVRQPPSIDWGRPWLAPYRLWGQELESPLPVGKPMADRLNSLSDLSMAASTGSQPFVQFVAASFQPPGEAYEAFIHRTGMVPTRDNWHDMFNGLVWWRFPSAKRRLNELQAAAIAAQGIGNVRGSLRDALTLFDENAALLQAPEPLKSALKRRDWTALFVTHRPLWAHARVTLFGHALMEKLVVPRKAITAHIWLLPDGFELDALLTASLEPTRLSSKPFLPMPVLGVPGWWQENEAISFYNDPAVFRVANPAGAI